LLRSLCRPVRCSILPRAAQDCGGYSLGENTGPTTIDVTGTFANYMRAVEPLYLEIFGKSLIVAGLTTVLCLIVGFPVALAIAFASPKTKAWLLLLIMLPFWTNLLIRTFALIAVLRENGYVNAIFEWFWNSGSGVMALVGLQPLGDFEPLTLLYNNTAVVIGLVYVHLPFMVLPLYSALDRMDRSLMEAASIWARATCAHLVGGCRWRRRIASGVLITFIPALGAYLTPDLLGGTDSQMIANVIERQFKRANDWPFGAALSFLLMYLTFIAIAVQAFVQRKSERRG
jgi:spermidine/putrescine transport system permease protein